MPDKPPHPCRNAGCPNLTRADYCEQHKRNNDAQDDAIDKLYRVARWFNFRKWFLAMNPACQKIENGRMCGRPGVIVHHLRSPREAPHLFIVASNCVAVCRRHHPPDDGTPWWEAGIDFVASQTEVHI